MNITDSTNPPVESSSSPADATAPAGGAGLRAPVTAPRASWLRRHWLGLVIALAVIGGGAWLLRSMFLKSEPTITFQTVPVGRGTIAAQVTANGTLSARSTVQVGAQVSGRVVELHADFNDRVTKGQVIAKLDQSVLMAQIDQAQAAHAVAVANYHRARVVLSDSQRQLSRQRVLQAQQLVAGASVEQAEVARDSAQASVAAAKAQVSQAEANLKQAKTNLTYTTIISPVDGVVLSRAVDVGQTVAASLQAPTLFTIAEDLSRMQIDTAVAEADVGKLKEGIKATFTVDAFPGQTFEGVVHQVRNAPVTTSGVVTYNAVIHVENEGQLRPGMTANVTFVLAQVANAIKIPNAALRFRPTRDQIVALREHFGIGGREGSGPSPRDRAARGGGEPGGRPDQSGARRESSERKGVWKLVDGVPRHVRIKLGLSDGSTTELVEGELAPGDELITEISGLPSAPRRTGAF